MFRSSKAKKSSRSLDVLDFAMGNFALSYYQTRIDALISIGRGTEFLDVFWEILKSILL